MLVTLLRHGEVQGRQQVLRGLSDEPLTPQGMRQLQHAWQTCTPAITHLASSPLIRCLAFAQAQASHHELPLLVLPELREIDFGDWDNLTLDEAAARDPDCYARFVHDTAHWQAPNGESYQQFRTRLRSILPTLIQTRTEHLLVITHGGVIRALLAELLQLTPASAACIGVSPACTCQLWVEQDARSSALSASLLRLQPCAL